ncbi:hypothetical protein EDI_125460 [Entamoeba dispar SAW760]|uniref:Uncharacterized protein n=1 Tax=Entamoeba dispar (strain ATCC PRA-260 / SAW760) TaxID=370354 RepID=B0EC52_ENTDS|nr:uncharacterized protein EDI_125460 [Entamoeba dispar SAW760]EDR27900.1 hypothetical protein EDI_125460 [Entamoeba dispar SAW760]|eukprot:EDR27900.1 hypothetical protein EDI_125460 [Entamoeba dispar SAW760]
MRYNYTTQCKKENHCSIGSRKPVKIFSLEEKRIKRQTINKQIVLLILQSCYELSQESDVISVCPNSPREINSYEIDDLINQVEQLLSGGQSLDCIYPYVKSLVRSYKQYYC